jgi:hypothetical protein
MLDKDIGSLSDIPSPDPFDSGRDSGGRWKKGNHHSTGHPRGARNKAARATVASLVAHGELLPHQKLREIGMDPKTSETIRVQALTGAAPYYAAKLSPIPSPDPPPATYVRQPFLIAPPSTMAEARELSGLIMQKLADGTLDLDAAKVLNATLATHINSLLGFDLQRLVEDYAERHNSAPSNVITLKGIS